jgi:cytochrome P450
VTKWKLSPEAVDFTERFVKQMKLWTVQANFRAERNGNDVAAELDKIISERRRNPRPGDRFPGRLFIEDPESGS